MFVHNHIVRTRVLALVLLVVPLYLGSAAIDAMTREPVRRLDIAVVLLLSALIAYGCWLMWKHADQFGNKVALPDPTKWVGPNAIDRKMRIGNIAASCFLLAYGIYALVNDDFYVPAKHGGTHFYGLAAWLAFASLCCVVVGLISEVVDHYDRRNNELTYAHIAAVSQWFAWTFFAAAVIHSWGR